MKQSIMLMKRILKTCDDSYLVEMMKTDIKKINNPGSNSDREDWFKDKTSLNLINRHFIKFYSLSYI